MDAKEKFKGQKVNLQCPHCNEDIEIGTSSVFGTDQTITCPACQTEIHLENSEALSKLRKQLDGLKKWTRS
ncbi:hypothetical protein [Halobacillus halophilus]|uniref:hypothetical protein n=1 Tax=Halobacillus halophilus TaxID=1570 RepID=UPI001CD7C9E5|nr:hypothetical protein [Halobacillus halophilus]MCA1009315.1 hypothetical protein [Halobacillus halophilus]